MAGNGIQQEDLMEMMRSMKGAFDGLATKVDSSIEAQDRMAKEFSDKLDNFVTNFKQEVH